MAPAARSCPARLFVWAGAMLFFVSLAFCVLRYETVMGRPVDGAVDPVTAVAFNAALFTVFALHHSVFARMRVRERVRRLVSEPLERSVYVWTASLLLIAVALLWQPVPGVAWRVTGAGALLLRVAQAAGIWLTIRSAAVIDVFELAGVRQLGLGRAQRPAPTHTTEAMEFRTTGPYGWVRHPIYSGWFVIVFCEPAMTATRLVFAVVSGLYLLVGILFEERSLRETTSGAYDRYITRVPWKLIPRVY